MSLCLSGFLICHKYFVPFQILRKLSFIYLKKKWGSANFDQYNFAFDFSFLFALLLIKFTRWVVSFPSTKVFSPTSRSAAFYTIFIHNSDLPHFDRIMQGNDSVATLQSQYRNVLMQQEERHVDEKRSLTESYLLKLSAIEAQLVDSQIRCEDLVQLQSVSFH